MHSLPKIGSLAALFHDNTCLIPENFGDFVRDMEVEVPRGYPAAFVNCATIKLSMSRVDRWRNKLQIGSLTRALKSRETLRDFAEQPIKYNKLATLLLESLAPGELRDSGLRRRPYPSAGGLYGVNVFLVVQNVVGILPGYYHVNADQHCLEVIAQFETGVEIDALRQSSFLGEDASRQTPAYLVLTGDLSLVRKKYGDRGYRFLLLEAGHIAQNIALVAADLKLAQIPLGGFCEHEFEEALKVKNWLRVLYVIAIGNQ